MRGGIQLLLHRLVEHLPGDVVVLTPERAGSAEVDAACGCEVVRTTHYADHRLAVARLNAATVAEARRRSPDVIIAGHLVAGPGALLARRVAGSAVVQYLYAMEIGRRPKLTRFVLARVDRAIAISSYTRQATLDAGAPAAAVDLVLPGVDLPGPVRREASGRPIVLTVARLEEAYKGFDVMLDALPLVRARVGEVQWVVVGAGALRGVLERTAAARGLSESVHFTGGVSDAERDGWLRRASVFAMPSRVPAPPAMGEGFGIVYLEAGAMGVPVVAGDEGGAQSAVGHDETGLLVNPRDHIAVADAVTRLLLDPELAQRLGRGGRARAEQMTWKRQADGVHAALERALAGRSRAGRGIL